MSAFSDSYVSRVLLATPPQGRGLDVVMRRWRWLRLRPADPNRTGTRAGAVRGAGASRRGI